jgi:hypothetical protein
MNFFLYRAFLLGDIIQGLSTSIILQDIILLSALYALHWALYEVLKWQFFKLIYAFLLV